MPGTRTIRWKNIDARIGFWRRPGIRRRDYQAVLNRCSALSNIGTAGSRAGSGDRSLQNVQYLLRLRAIRMGMANSVEAGSLPGCPARRMFANRSSHAEAPRLREKHLLKQAARPWLPEQICRRSSPYRGLSISFFKRIHAGLLGELLSGRV